MLTRRFIRVLNVPRIAEKPRQPLGLWCSLVLGAVAASTTTMAAPFEPPSPKLYTHLFEKDILPSFEPVTALDVTFGDKALDFGIQMELRETKKAPAVAFEGRHGALYTLLCIDPDAPGPKEPLMRNWLHWLVTNIPASADVASGSTVMDYAPPTPPKGNHRYVFVLLEQPQASHGHSHGGAGGGGAAGRLAVDTPVGRGKFNAPAFIAAHDLTPVGLQFMCVHAAENWGRR